MGIFKCYLSVAVVSVQLDKVLDKGALPVTRIWLVVEPWR